MMPAGPNKCESGVSPAAAAGGTSLRIRNRLTSHLTAPALSKNAATPNSAAPRAANSPAVQALGTRAGRFGHHHDSGEIMGARPLSVRTMGSGAAGWARHRPEGMSQLRRPGPPLP